MGVGKGLGRPGRSVAVATAHLLTSDTPLSLSLSLALALARALSQSRAPERFGPIWAEGRLTYGFRSKI
jgi:hypothetical protein